MVEFTDAPEVDTFPITPPRSRTKAKKVTIPSYIRKEWATLYRNFRVRHTKLKQGPLKTAYEIVDDWMEGQS